MECVRGSVDRVEWRKLYPHQIAPVVAGGPKETSSDLAWPHLTLSLLLFNIFICGYAFLSLLDAYNYEMRFLFAIELLKMSDSRDYHACTKEPMLMIVLSTELLRYAAENFLTIAMLDLFLWIHSN